MNSSPNQLKKFKKLIARYKNHRIFHGSIILAILAVTSFAYESFKSYETEIKKAEIQTSNLAQVLEGQIAISFKNIDLILQSLQDKIGAGDITSGNYKKYNDILKNHRSRVPEVLSIKVSNEHGEFIADDRGTISKNVNLRDRDYFKKFASDPANRLIISKPLISKTASVWVIVLSRPWLSEEGKFKGVILATIEIEHYKKMFDDINVDNNGTIALYDMDKVLYARKPFSDKLGHVVNLYSDILKITTGDIKSVTYRTDSIVDKVNRVFSARKMSNYPFIVVAGLSSSEVLYEWKMRTSIHSLIIFFVLSMAFYFLMNSLDSFEQVEDQRRQAMQSAKLSALGEMASGIAHEINNPLSIISMSAHNLLKHRTDISADPKLHEGLERIIATSDRIAKIVRGLRSFSRDSFDDPYLLASVDKIIESTLDLCHEKIKGRSVILKVNNDGNYHINCCEIQIVQVLMNLLNNSLDAIEHDEHRWINIDVTNIGNQTIISVSDSGTKIPTEIAEKIMNPFFTTKDVGKGTGLGLSISKGIIENHKGRFYLDQKKSHTTFVIELPEAQEIAKVA